MPVNVEYITISIGHIQRGDVHNLRKTYRIFDELIFAPSAYETCNYMFVFTRYQAVPSCHNPAARQSVGSASISTYVLRIEI
jgi:hypothetical protein